MNSSIKLIIKPINKPNLACLVSSKDGPKLGPKGAWAPSGPNFFLVIIFFIFVVRSLPKLQAPFLHNKPNQLHPNSNYPTKKLNKNNKNIHNDDFILAKKKLFYHQRIRKSCIIGKVKTKFFATTINQYKNQLTVASL